jgi:curved DNA-binding protein CbpA
MNGDISEQPLAEIIREISSKSLSGRLRLERDRVQVVAYFEKGNFTYAASNLRSLRLREYLKKSELVSEADLARFNERVPDVELLKQLSAQNLLTAAVVEQAQTRQVADVLRLALLWTDGTWEFDVKSRLGEQIKLEIDIDSLLLEAARRLPATLIASRFADQAEVITPVSEQIINDNLLPAEGFLLSRLERPTPLSELLAITGLGEEETLRLVYSLAVTGLVQREHWKPAFVQQRAAPKPLPAEPAPPPPPPAPVEPEQSREIDLTEVENFLNRVKSAQTHYDVLAVNDDVAGDELKTIYYQLARRYHPDRFRRQEASLLTRIESAFARITQAYETLRNDNLRASYNSKLAARKKVERIAESAPKATAPSSKPEAVAERVAEPVMSAAERAEIQFKEGFAALELGQRKVALGLFAAAASAIPNEPRYRAFYGQMLAGNENTRRAGETELIAAIKLDPNNAEYRVMLAELYRDLGLKLRAKGEAERAVAADPNNRKARELLQALK